MPEQCSASHLEAVSETSDQFRMWWSPIIIAEASAMLTHLVTTSTGLPLKDSSLNTIFRVVHTAAFGHRPIHFCCNDSRLLGLPTKVYDHRQTHAFIKLVTARQTR